MSDPGVGALPFPFRESENRARSPVKQFRSSASLRRREANAHQGRSKIPSKNNIFVMFRFFNVFVDKRFADGIVSLKFRAEER